MEKLIACPYKRPNALFRFPWAGGGTSQLAQRGKLFSSSTEVLSVRLPGSDPCHMKPFAKDVTAMVNEITSVLLKELQEKTSAFFGHSFGSYISFAVALHFKENYGLEPIHLFISGTHAPHSEAFLHMRSLPVQDTEYEDILKYVQTLGGTSFELLKDEDVKKHLILSWHDLTRGYTSFYKLPGGHFYLLEPSNEIFLTKHLARCIEYAGL